MVFFCGKKGVKNLRNNLVWNATTIISYTDTNIIAYYKGEETSTRLWILTHMDVVPPGDLDKWRVTEPFKPLIKDGKIYGRGSEDNGQSIVASIYAVKALMDRGIKPKRDIVLAFVSDEETGSKYGLEWLIENHPELFSKNDCALVPDGGNEEGTFIEIAEKGMLWIKLKFHGKQVHASLPHKGLNAYRIALGCLKELDDHLHLEFGMENSLFEPPYSTFEPTVGKSSSESPNIIPGMYETTFDCRIIPEYSVDQVIEEIENFVKSKANAEIEILHRMDSPPTDPECEVVQLLKRAIKELRKKEAKVGGIGGGTFAAYLRRIGIPSVVWATLDNVAHQPDEYARIQNIIEDAKVMAAMALL